MYIYINNRLSEKEREEWEGKRGRELFFMVIFLFFVERVWGSWGGGGRWYKFCGIVWLDLRWEENCDEE